MKEFFTFVYHRFLSGIFSENLQVARTFLGEDISEVKVLSIKTSFRGRVTAQPTSLTQTGYFVETW